MISKRKPLVVFVGLLLIVTAPLFVLEIALRLTNRNVAYNVVGQPITARLNPLSYLSPFYLQNEGWLHVRRPFEQAVYPNQEYDFSFHANSIGCNDKEWTLQKKKYRIACFGDSYTEGVGASADSTYTKKLESCVDTVEVMNCGIAGSDPFFGYMLLQQKILAYKPDRVFITINESDLNDFMIHGGFERFGKDGNTYTKKGPWWEWIYGMSYIVRLIALEYFHLNFVFLSPEEAEKKKAECLQQIDECLDKFQTLCNINHVRCTFVFHPSFEEILSGELFFMPVLDYAQKKNYDTINLLDFFHNYGINAENAGNYFWQIDRHYNNAGYQLFAQALKSKL